MGNRTNQSEARREELANGAVVRECMVVGDVTLRRVWHQAGWRWTTVFGSSAQPRCEKRHVGMMLEGAMVVEDAAGEQYRLVAGDFFVIEPDHDAWVDGDLPATMLEVECPRRTDE